MKLDIIQKDGKGKGSVELPAQFKDPVRKDIIKRAVISLQMAARQPYGASPEAGKRASAFLSKRRRKYRGTYGIGQSRTPRKILSRSGTRIYYVGAFAPQTVGGRRAHPPKATKEWDQKVNEKENRKAIRSALSATIDKEMVKGRGHKIPDNFPFIISDDFQNMNKTSELMKALKGLKFDAELERASIKKIRAGKGKNRGRKYKKKKGILFVVSEKCELEKAARNIPGTEVVMVNSLNAELLAPGAEPGRLTLYSESSIKKLKDEKLFMNDYKGEKVEKKAAVKKTAKKKEVSAKKKKTVKKKAPKKKAIKEPAKKAEAAQ